ncbi:hypothetical protein [Candidatus Uabimicrobium amorphum]|uniref:Uncharacterized protein n=1 Tax=Uabimicrobium amorphum TaxID=2596890 RepID=A0A5S9INY4_UABAM|nr:hypothetical protein [Candidatus Uabimicrobium amorphum]BBM85007.1 hypothetical protein UABAM_03370 [Candidatus Uabimicrobium amorphum]
MKSTLVESSIVKNQKVVYHEHLTPQGTKKYNDDEVIHDHDFQVSVQKNADVVTGVVVNCGCGKSIVIHFSY